MLRRGGSRVDDDVKRRPSDGKGRIGRVGLYASAGTR